MTNKKSRPYEAVNRLPAPRRKRRTDLVDGPPSE